MGTITPAELWSMIASVVSVAVGFLAIGMSIYFFVVGQKASKEASTSLVKIETQAEMLQKLSGRQLDRLTKYVTEQKPHSEEPKVVELFIQLLDLAKPLTASLQQGTSATSVDQLRAELLTCYIGLYYYIAVTNHWSQGYLPGVEEYDETNEFHLLTRRVIDQSAADFTLMAGILAKCNQMELQVNPLAHLLKEAQEFWRATVRSSADVYITRGKDSAS